METLTPSQFAAKAQPLLGLPNFWSLAGPSVAGTPANNSFENPGTGVPAANQAGGWRDVFSRALKLVNPLSVMSPTQDAIAYATKEAGQGGGKVMAAAASAVDSASAGIKSGLSWGIFVVVIVLMAYLLAIAAPFLPKPAMRGA